MANDDDISSDPSEYSDVNNDDSDHSSSPNTIDASSTGIMHKKENHTRLPQNIKMNETNTILCNQCQRHILFHEYQSHLLMHGLLLHLTQNNNQITSPMNATETTNISNINLFPLQSIKCKPEIKLSHSTSIKQEQFSLMNHNTSHNGNNGHCKNENKSSLKSKSKFERTELESLCLDELLAKALTYKPDLEWNINWCRFCGARASASFFSSPWGTKQLCSIHHKMWKEEKLDLSMYNGPKKIESVINKSQCTEREYLINILTKVDMNTAQIGNRRSLRNKRIKMEKVLDFSSESESLSDSESSSNSWNVSCSQSASSEYESSEYDSSDFEPKRETMIKLENTYSSKKGQKKKHKIRTDIKHERKSQNIQNQKGTTGQTI